MPRLPESDRVAGARDYGRFWGAAAAILLVDQLAKLAVRHWLSLGVSLPVIPRILDLTHVQNPGAAFGVFPGGTAAFLVVSLGVCSFLGAAGPRLCLGRPLLFWALSCQFGGALGNLLDRLVFGAVTDFLDFHVWPVFNLADCALTVGAGLLILYLIRYERRAVAKEGSTCDPS